MVGKLFKRFFTHTDNIQYKHFILTYYLNLISLDLIKIKNHNLTLK